MSVDHFYCFLWVKILWDINLFAVDVVLISVCVCTNTIYGEIAWPYLQRWLLKKTCLVKTMVLESEDPPNLIYKGEKKNINK